MGEQSWTFTIGPITFDGTILTMSLLTVLLVFGLIFWSSRRMQVRPSGRQNVLEYAFDFVNNINGELLGAKEARKFSLFSFSLFSFLLVSNIIGLLTKIDGPGEITFWKSPTANATVTLTLALLITLVANISGVEKFGLGTYIKNSFLKPSAAMLPMNILEEFTNTLSLGLRLYGNIFAGELLLGLLAQLGNMSWVSLPFALVLELVWTGFSIFISALQAYVFVLLTGIYLSHKVLLEEE